MDAETQRIQYCVDGDSTSILGEGCWQDPRMANAFSLSLGLKGLPAVFAGREEYWREYVDGTCDAPTETSLFDPP